LSQLDAQDELVPPLSHAVYIGHTNVVADLVISSQDICETVVHRRMADHFALNHREKRVHSLPPNVGMNRISRSEHNNINLYGTQPHPLWHEPQPS